MPVQQQQQHHHRPTLSQSNKAFKSKHSSKGALKEAAKGRIARSSLKAAASYKSCTPGSAGAKAARRNQAKQLQAQKRKALREASRIFAGGAGEAGAPKIGLVVGLCPGLGTKELDDAVRKLECQETLGNGLDAAMGEAAGAEPALGFRIFQLPSHLHSKAHGAAGKLQLLVMPHETPLAALLAASLGADYLLPVLSAAEPASTWGETVLRSLSALGSCASGTLGLVSGLEEIEGGLKEQSKVRASLLSYLRYFFPPASSTGAALAATAAGAIGEGSSGTGGLLLDKISSLSNPGEVANVLRCLAERTVRESAWRSGRGRMVAEEIAFTPSAPGAEPGSGTLAVTGFIRGAPVSANRLVHIPLCGDFRVSHITAAPLPSASSRRKVGEGVGMDVEPEAGAVLMQRTSGETAEEADDLASTNVPDEGEDLMKEQTWPTEEELASAPAAMGAKTTGQLPDAPVGTTPRRVKRVPTGTSAYQAAWLPDSDSGSGDDEYTDMDDGDDGNGAQDADSLDGKAGSVAGSEEYEELDMTGEASAGGSSKRDASGTGKGKGVSFVDLPEDVEASQLAAYLSSQSRIRSTAEKDDAQFPDEMDTPVDVPARERFARFRGMRSLRTGEWDPYEGLPEEYGRLFGFEDWKSLGRRLAKRAVGEANAPRPGRRVTVHVENFPGSLYASLNLSHPLVLHSLLKHEHKYTVMHFTAQRNTEFTAPIRSKDPLLVVVGPRIFEVNPVWSQHTQNRGGKGHNNVHKFERWLRPGAGVSVGTSYLPATFGPAPVVVLKPGSGEAEGMDLVASGSVLSSDPTRVVAKRVVLTGHPYKVHKRVATIRYMFFNRADVEYFKPLQLKTKKGRTGFIREPLGTHGYFKAGFDGPLDQMDTVCMSLYKRCYPKWGKAWVAHAAVEAAAAAAAFACADAGDEDVEMS